MKEKTTVWLETNEDTDITALLAAIEAPLQAAERLRNALKKIKAPLATNPDQLFWSHNGMLIRIVNAGQLAEHLKALGIDFEDAHAEHTDEPPRGILLNFMRIATRFGWFDTP